MPRVDIDRGAYIVIVVIYSYCTVLYCTDPDGKVHPEFCEANLAKDSKYFDGSSHA